MRKYSFVLVVFIALAIGATHLMGAAAANAASAAELEKGANAALKKLYASTPKAKELAAQAKGILVFPSVVKAGFMVGGLYGEGALSKQGKTVGYYSTVAASYGLQVGAQKYGYAMFLMNDAAIQYLDKSDGWEVGTGPSIVVVDKGAAGGLSTTNLRDDVYAFIFSQEGLMAGLGLHGTKITRIKK